MELYDFFLSLNNLEIAVLLFCSCVGFGVFLGVLRIFFWCFLLGLFLSLVL